MKSAYLSGRQIAKIILMEAVNGNIKYSRYIYRLSSSADATQKAMEETTRLQIPNDARMALLELCGTLGRYDLDGENRMLQLSGQRINAALERCEAEKKPMARSCAALGISAGIALVILMV